MAQPVRSGEPTSIPEEVPNSPRGTSLKKIGKTAAFYIAPSSEKLSPKGAELLEHPKVTKTRREAFVPHSREVEHACRELQNIATLLENNKVLHVKKSGVLFTRVKGPKKVTQAAIKKSDRAAKALFSIMERAVNLAENQAMPSVGSWYKSLLQNEWAARALQHIGKDSEAVGLLFRRVHNALMEPLSVKDLENLQEQISHIIDNSWLQEAVRTPENSQNAVHVLTLLTKKIEEAARARQSCPELSTLTSSCLALCETARALAKTSAVDTNTMQMLQTGLENLRDTLPSIAKQKCSAALQQKNWPQLFESLAALDAMGKEIGKALNKKELAFAAADFLEEDDFGKQVAQDLEDTFKGPVQFGTDGTLSEGVKQGIFLIMDSCSDELRAKLDTLLRRENITSLIEAYCDKQVAEKKCLEVDKEVRKDLRQTIQQAPLSVMYSAKNEKEVADTLFDEAKKMRFSNQPEEKRANLLKFTKEFVEVCRRSGTLENASETLQKSLRLQGVSQKECLFLLTQKASPKYEEGKGSISAFLEAITPDTRSKNIDIITDDLVTSTKRLYAQSLSPRRFYDSDPFKDVEGNTNLNISRWSSNLFERVKERIESSEGRGKQEAELWIDIATRCLDKGDLASASTIFMAVECWNPPVTAGRKAHVSTAHKEKMNKLRALFDTNARNVSALRSYIEAHWASGIIPPTAHLSRDSVSLREFRRGGLDPEMTLANDTFAKLCDLKGYAARSLAENPKTTLNISAWLAGLVPPPKPLTR